MLNWASQSTATGPGVVYDVAGGLLSQLRLSGLSAATSCVGSNLASPTYSDARALPASGDGYFYVVRAKNACGSGSFGPGRAGIDGLACP